MAISTILMSCEKNYTVFLEDDDAEDLSVFSDNGNNVMTCYINGKSFRTKDRIVRYGFYAHDDTEINLSKYVFDADSDTLIIRWQANPSSPEPSSISLVLPVKKDFSYNDFNAFNGKRLAVDGVNGYFMINQYSWEKGTGNIYFHQASLLQNDPDGTGSHFSGIFEATLPSYKITRGRFDHSLPVGGSGGVVFF